MERSGVDAIFGVPGGANLPFYDALYESEIRSFLMRHEQQAAHAAEGYARVKGKPGVCSGTSGPGATNLITGLVDASMDSVPVLAITGQVVRAFMGADAFQEADIVGMVLPHIKYATTVKDPRRLVQEFVNAYSITMSGRPGPALLDIPRDVMQEELTLESEEVRPEPLFFAKPPEPSASSIMEAAKLIMDSKKPTILCGGGVVYSRATQEVLELAEHIAAPIVTTTPGKGSVPETHPLVLGVVGMHGRAEADLALIESDLVVCVGTRLSDRAVGPGKDFERNRKVIHIDIDASEFGKNVKPTVALRGDAKQVVRELVDYIRYALPKRPESLFVEKLKEIGEAYDEYMISTGDRSKLSSAAVVSLLNKELPHDAIVTTGVGQHQMWAQLFLRQTRPNSWISSGGLGTMGFGLPAAFGAKAADPSRIVVNMDGDGSFIMTCQTLACIKDYDLPVISVIFDNRTLGMVRQWQDMFYGKRYKDVDYTDTTDLVKLSESFGVPGTRVETYEELRSTVRKAVRNNEAITIDVPTNREESVYPMVPPGKWLADVLLPPGFELQSKTPSINPIL